MLSRAETKLLAGLKRRRVREREGLFLAEGARVVRDLLASGLDFRLALVSSSFEDSEEGAVLAAALAARGALRRVEDRVLAELADTETPQGVLVAAPIPRPGLRGIEPGPPVIVLDGVQDPGNVGTIVRSAHALGAAFVAALAGTADPWSPKVVRSAAGALFRLPVLQPDLEELIDWLRRHDYRIWGAAAAGEPVEGLPRERRVALALGNEGVGLGAGLQGRLDRRVAIPLHPEAESLNVAVAAGILLYLLTRGGDLLARGEAKSEP